MMIWLVLRGTGCIECDPPGPSVEFKAGSLMLFPAAMSPAAARVSSAGDCEMLEISLPG
jgi:mannose-6-phosphate isomerase-like protein (cupin superfamily)